MANLYLTSGDNLTGLTFGGNVFGAAGSETVSYASGASGIVVDQNVEEVRLAGSTSSYTFQQQGTSLVVFSGATQVAKISLQDDTNGTLIAFANGRVEAKIVAGSPPTVTLGGTTVPTTAGAVVPAVIDASAGTGVQTITLTTSVDTVVGGAGNDVIDGVINGASSTLTALDSIDGGAGSDTLNILDVTGAGIPAGVQVKNVENAVVRSAGNATVDSTTWTGLTSLKSTQSVDANLTAAATTDVEVASATGDITVDGGKNTIVTDATAGNNVTVGATTVGAGSVTVTDSNQTSGAISIDGGTSVAVTASKATTGTVDIGQGGAATDAPSGAVSVTTTGAAYAATDGNATRGAINITGGSTVNVSQTATSDSAAAATDTTNATVTQSDVNVTGTATTTSVTVSQSSAVTAANATIAVAGANETQTVTFVALAAGESTTVNGLTFTASKALTAAEAAAAFANVANGASFGPAAAGNGIYSGTFSTIAGSTGAVTTAAGVSTVTFTSAQQANVAPLTVGDTAAAGNVSVVTVADGSAATVAATGKLGVVGGAVAVNGAITGTDVLATVSLTGYGAGSTVASDALTSLSLANSKADVTVTNAAATTLGLSLNNVGTGSLADIGGTYTTLNVTATGADSDVTLVAGGVQTLSVAGDKAVDLTGATLTALKTVTVSGSAGLTIDASGANVTSVNTSATTGTVTATVDGSKATYTGGAGADNVTLSSTTVSKAISLGAGNDKVVLAAGTTALTATVSGGEGTDTLEMAVADAATASASNVFETKIDGFEKLSLTGVAGSAQTVDLANVDDINYVISANGTGTAEVQTIDFTGSTATANGDITVGGATVTLANTDTAAQIAAKVAAQLTALAAGTALGDATYSAVGAVVTITYAAANGDVAQALVVDGTAAIGGNPVEATTTQGTGSLTLTNVGANGTLELTGAGAGATVTLADATGTSDSFNIVTKVNAADLNFGTVSVAGVETVNITATDTTPVNALTGAATISKGTLTVADTAVKAIVVTGNSDLDLTATGAALTSVDASALTGKFTFTSAVNSAVITGGSAADVLTGNGNSQILNGGAGADTLIVGGDLQTLTGGAGNDVFNVANATTNVNSYATITDLAKGDTIKFTGAAADFVAAKVTLGDTAVFQDLANAAIANSDTGDVAWFQFGGNTYAIENVSNSTTAFQNNQDVIVKISGLVDLSTAAFSSSSNSLLIA